MEKRTIKLLKKLAREENKIPPEKVEKPKKKYKRNRKHKNHKWEEE